MSPNTIRGLRRSRQPCLRFYRLTRRSCMAAARIPTATPMMMIQTTSPAYQGSTLVIVTPPGLRRPALSWRPPPPPRTPLAIIDATLRRIGKRRGTPRRRVIDQVIKCRLVLGWWTLQRGEKGPARVGYAPLARLAHNQLFAEDVHAAAGTGLHALHPRRPFRPAGHEHGKIALQLFERRPAAGMAARTLRIVS